MGQRYKICIFTPEIHDTISKEIISGILSEASKNRVDVTLVSAGGVRDSDGNLNESLNLYNRVVNDNHFDGIIILTGSMINFSNNNEMLEFLEPFKETPVINLSVEVPGYHSIVSNNITPVEKLVEHIILKHKKNRIVFIKGPLEHYEAEERFTGYKNALKKHNIALDYNYIYEGNFSPHKGAEAVKLILSSNTPRPDAIVCADDDTALGVYSELRRNGITIGKDGIIVTGFDNMEYTRTMEPALTTIDQNFHGLGKHSVKSFIQIINGNEKKETLYIPNIIFRESCGCDEFEEDLNKDEISLVELVSNRFEDLHIDDLERNISNIADILDKFTMIGEYNFVPEIEEFINKFKFKGYNLKILKEIIRILSIKLTPKMNRDELRSFYMQLERINSTIIDSVTNEKVREYRSFSEQSSELDAVLMGLASAMSIEELENAMETNFFYLGIKSFSLYFEKPDEALSHINGKIYEKDDSLNRSKASYCSLYLPVTSSVLDGYCHFYILLDSFTVGEVLAFQISRTLYTIEVFNHLNEKIKEIDQSYTDLRTTKDLLMENEQLANLGGLVAGFTHEISTPIGVGVTAVTHMIEELRKVKEQYHNNSLKRSGMDNFFNQSESGLDIIYKNLERTSTLINGFKQISVDQASDVKRTIELTSYLQEIVHSLSPILRRGKHKVNILSEDKYIIDSYPGAISQIITNLVQNSVKHGFEDIEGGEIVIHLSRDEDKIKLTYNDNGIGIDKEVQSKVFESYYSTKIGKGGSGLGLSIIKKLTEDKLLGTIECTGEKEDGATFILTL